MDDHEESAVTPDPGFFGSTSYSAVFNEESGIDGVPSRAYEDAAYRDFGGPSTYREGRVEQGVQVLAQLSQMDRYEPLVQQWQDDIHGLSKYDVFL